MISYEVWTAIRRKDGKPYPIAFISMEEPLKASIIFNDPRLSGVGEVCRGCRLTQEEGETRMAFKIRVVAKLHEEDGRLNEIRELERRLHFLKM